MQWQQLPDLLAGLGPTGLMSVALYFLVKEVKRLQVALDASEAARLQEAKESARAMLSFIREAQSSQPTIPNGKTTPP